MFDVDGTLVDSVDFDGELYAQAIREVLHLEVDRTWRSYRDVTDSGVLEELLEQSRFDGSRDVLRAQVKRRFIELVRGYVAADPLALREISGATALLRTLGALPGVRVAVATGCWAESAVLKLGAIGCDLGNIAVATSSDDRARTSIMQLAEQRAMAGKAPITKTYFGDAAWDQRASAALGYRFIAIGREVQHEHRFDDFRDLRAVLDCLGL